MTSERRGMRRVSGRPGLIAAAVVLAPALALAAPTPPPPRPQSSRTTHADRQAVANRMKAAREKAATQGATKAPRPDAKGTR